MRKLIIGILLTTVLTACTHRTAPQNDTLYVSILPIKGLVKAIVGDDFPIEVLVPAGASPETFEPTPRQFIALNQAQLVFNVGLIDFETSLLSKIEQQGKIIDLSRGIDLIAGTCSHNHHGEKHAHGIDPHIWTSPRTLQQMATNAYEAIHAAYPDSVKYTTAYHKLQEELTALDARTGAKIAAAGVKYFIIYHPALTYYARDYGIEQLAIEAEGKDPSAKRLSEIIRRARADRVQRIYYQNQFPASTVEIIARDIEAQYVEIDPLREDCVQNLDAITDLIVRQ